MCMAWSVSVCLTSTSTACTHQLGGLTLCWLVFWASRMSIKNCHDRHVCFILAPILPFQTSGGETRFLWLGWQISNQYMDGKTITTAEENLESPTNTTLAKTDVLWCSHARRQQSLDLDWSLLMKHLCCRYEQFETWGSTCTLSLMHMCKIPRMLCVSLR